MHVVLHTRRDNWFDSPLALSGEGDVSETFIDSLLCEAVPEIFEPNSQADFSFAKER